MARWLSMFEDTCRFPARENECLGWHEARITAALKTPGYVSARVYKIKQVRNGRGQFITLYEIDSDDIAATLALGDSRLAAESARNAEPDSLMMPLWTNVLWREIAAVPADMASRKTGNWVNLIEINCADPQREGRCKPRQGMPNAGKKGIRGGGAPGNQPAKGERALRYAARQWKTRVQPTN